MRSSRRNSIANAWPREEATSCSSPSPRSGPSAFLLAEKATESLRSAIPRKRPTVDGRHDVPAQDVRTPSFTFEKNGDRVLLVRGSPLELPARESAGRVRMIQRPLPAPFTAAVSATPARASRGKMGASEGDGNGPQAKQLPVSRLEATLLISPSTNSGKSRSRCLKSSNRGRSDYHGTAWPSSNQAGRIAQSEQFLELSGRT
jgi:hypothetical protein